MNDNINTIGKTALSGDQWSVGVAYIALPSNVERDIYIRECYQNSRVSIWSENAGFLNRVPIDSDTINFIEFPEVLEKFGTAVVFVTEPIHKQPIIIGRLPKTDELGELRENQFKIKRKLGNKIVEISGSPEKGVLNLIVDSEGERGAFNIVLTNTNDDGELNISIAGDIKVNTTGNVEFIQKEKFAVHTTGGEEAFYEQASEEHRFQGKKLVLNQGTESMVLGNKLDSFLKSLLDELSAITVISPMGPLPLNPANLSKIQSYKTKISNVLSTEGFLKK